MYLSLSDIEIKHTLFGVSSSSFLSGSLSLSKTENDLLRIKQQMIEHAKNTKFITSTLILLGANMTL